MFKPKYAITPKLLENIKRIAVMIPELNRQKPQKVVLFELERKAREISAHSSTSIEGNPLPLTEVKRILKNAPAHARDSEKEVLNYNDILLKLNQKMESGELPMTLNLILEIHNSVMKNRLPKAECGQIRRAAVFVNNPKTGQPIFLPPDHQDVLRLMEDLIQFTFDNMNKLDPLILAGLFHKQFVIIHPFLDGNGRTTRLATKVLLAHMGLSTFNLFSFENFYNKNVSHYFEKVGVLGNYYEKKNVIDFTEWLEYFTDGIIDELLRIQKLLEAKPKLKSPADELKGHHQKILKIIEETGYITDALYAKKTKRAKATRALDFKFLIEQGAIERLGKGKNTYYRLKENTNKK